MKINIGTKIIDVDVRSDDCNLYSCFAPHRYQHKGYTINGKQNNWTDRHYSCSYRNYHGCPDKPKLKKELKE